jgi:hypothetical protein
MGFDFYALRTTEHCPRSHREIYADLQVLALIGEMVWPELQD